jgi:hypothetical protein
MTRPHEILGLPQPLGRRLPQGIVAWNIVISVASLIVVIAYIVMVNTTASKGYALRTSEKRMAGLKMETEILQTALISASSMHHLQEQAGALGLVPIENVAYVTPGASSYALAK